MAESLEQAAKELLEERWENMAGDKLGIEHARLG